MRGIFIMSVGLAIAIGGCALATFIHMSHPDSQLYELFAMAQVVMLGMFGMGIFDEGKTEFKKRFARAKAPPGRPARRRS